MLLKQLRTLLLGKCLELDDEAKDGCKDMHVISTAVLRVSAHDAEMHRHSPHVCARPGANICMRSGVRPLLPLARGLTAR